MAPTWAGWIPKLVKEYLRITRFNRMLTFAIYDQTLRCTDTAALLGFGHYR